MSSHDPVDPANSPPIAIGGRIVTMDEAGTVVDDGVLYARDGSIVDVRPAAAAPPAGFEAVAVAKTRGTVFPGLIELHNHLPYDVLGLWQVPKQYANRDQWSGPSNPDYQRLITGPMQRLGADPTTAAAIVRFVEIALPARRYDDEPGDHARLGVGDRHALPRPRPQRRVDGRSRTAARRRPHIADVEATDGDEVPARGSRASTS